MDLHDKKIFVMGSGGMVGGAVTSELERRGYRSLIGSRSSELDLRRQDDVEEFFSIEKPQIVIVAAAKVGGILANNTYRAEFIYDNLMIEANAINSSQRSGVEKLIFLGSSCIYPKLCPQPIKEEYLLTGELEPTNEPYALAKIAGIKLCESYYRQYGCNFIAAMPTNLYGPNDNFDLSSSHVIPAMIRKFHEAKVEGADSVDLWGTGKPLREFMYVGDVADAIIFLMENVDAHELYGKGISHINVGTGEDLRIKELANMIRAITGFEGTVHFNPEMPDGTPRKLLDTSRLTNLGWKYSVSLEKGLKDTYEWFLENAAAPTVRGAADYV
ncbi:MAG TPA: GDP-L-fucose synthase [Pyrinomonadaceae bacterium]|nr:GDP-L-fucose synthase [Pyrinomonadaceae bacterium]